MQNPIDAFLAQRPVMILDGALATELESRGADLQDPLWSAKYLIEQPQLIRAVHLDYFRAGADVAITATYQLTFEACARRGIDSRAAAQLMRDGVALAIAAREEFWSVTANRTGRLRPLVAASVGPYGAMLADGSEYRGRYALNDDALADFHRPRLRVLASAGADLLACETIPCLREALLLAQMLREFPGVCAWMSFSCRDGERTSEGESIAACAAALRDYPQVAAVGVNCTAPQHIASLLQRLREATDKPLLVYPNSGETYDPSSKRWSGPADARGVDVRGAPAPGAVAPPFAEMARLWYAAGARLIGGCCRTGPLDIRGVRQCLIREQLL